MEALRAWAKKQVVRDLIETATDGWPRKTLVFTSFVGKAARDLRETLQNVVESSWKVAREHHAWKRLAREAAHGLLLVTRNIEGFITREQTLSRSTEAQELVRALQDLSITPGKELVHQLLGHPRFRRILMADLRRRLKALSQVLNSSQREEKWWERLHREERRNLRNTIRALGRSSLVATYTGHDDRRERDASGEAFRSPLAPWVLIASNVGSEGIDLHTFSAHLVHFDIEWNPARMEQREGRIDRLGRKLKDAVNVYFIFVRGTYDERMLHQLIVRQRWHSVLLGRTGARLARDNKGTIRARWIDDDSVQKLALDLRPIKR
jgi:hypothetical protein